VSFERSAFLDLMVQTITVSTVATLGVGGAPTYSTAQTSYRARVVNTNKFVSDGRGGGAAVAYEAWIASTGILAPGSKYTLPDGATPPVVRVDTFPDESGHHHVRILFGRN
jgi:hypothetical protein